MTGRGIESGAGTVLISAAPEQGHIISPIHMEGLVKNQHLASDDGLMTLDAVEALIGDVFFVPAAQRTRVVADVMAVAAGGLIKTDPERGVRAAAPAELPMAVNV